MIDDHAIAIIGMSCRLPTCDGIDQLWPMLLDGRRRTNFTSERPHRVAPFHENLLDGIEEFDPFAFGISPREAAEMDPQQRLLLHVGAEALYDAGMTPAGTAGSRTACYVGALWSDYLSRQRLQPDPSSYSACNTLSFLANRLSYVFDWSGPSVTIDTACSSSLVAVEFACRALISGDAGLAMVAGVNLILHPQSTLAIRKLGAMSSVGVCRPFDRSADGLVRAEGCGAVVLKRAWDLTENERAYALIHSGALTHTGRGPSMMTPSTEAYLDLFERAFASGSGTPSEVGYYEAHGTGTKLGDSAELAGVQGFLGRFPRSRGPCRIGSIKGVFGHCEGAAGIMGLISTALSIYWRTIPPPAARTTLPTDTAMSRPG